MLFLLSSPFDDTSCAPFSLFICFFLTIFTVLRMIAALKSGIKLQSDSVTMSQHILLSCEGGVLSLDL